MTWRLADVPTGNTTTLNKTPRNEIRCPDCNCALLSQADRHRGRCDAHCRHCGHPLWAPQSRRRGYCQACEITARRAFFCIDCGKDTIHREYYEVDHDLWDRCGAGAAMLCIGCLESRIERRLTPADFPDCEVNNTHLSLKSRRLRDRLGRRVRNTAGCGCDHCERQRATRKTQAVPVRTV
jgi:hypothetical protein